MKLKIRRLHPKAKLPTRAYEGDLGYDLYAVEDVILKPLKPTAVPTGIAVEFPKGWGAFLKDRSSMAIRGVHTLAGVIDWGYRGEIKVVMISFTERIRIRVGEKIAQMVPIKVVEWEIEENEIGETFRGNRGFGSSGKV
ncbi:MAG: dUTP diphosphatase [Thermotogae bacterium]|nr:dUTP diphosphatase [Thermotogota bacterium]